MEMRGNAQLMSYYRSINRRANCDVNKPGSSRKRLFLRMGAWREFIIASTFVSLAGLWNRCATPKYLNCYYFKRSDYFMNNDLWPV